MITQGGIARPGTIGFMPAMFDFAARVSERFDLTVYGTSSGENDEGSFSCGKARVILTKAKFSDSIFKKIRMIAAAVLHDHRTDPFDMIHGQWALPGGVIAVGLGKILGLPSVVTIRGADAASVREVGYGHFLRARTRIPTRWACARSTVLTTLTAFQIQQLSRYGLKRKDIRAIPVGVDTGLFKPPHLPRPQPPPLNLLHVGNITGVKNHDGLLRLFKTLTERIDARLRVIGPDYMNGQIQRLAESLGLAERTEFLGRVRHEDLVGHYQWAHLLLHTSFYEGQGMVIAEAAACGTIPCGSRVGLLADLDGICSVSAQPGNTGGLAKMILDLLDSSSQMDKLRANGRDWAVQNDIHWTVDQYTRLYNNVLAGGGAGD